MPQQPLDIIFEDNHLIVINKPVGRLVQGDSTGDEPLSDTVKTYIKHKYNKPGNVYLGVVHRLDRPTSGVLVFAKTSKALSRLNKQFSERQTQKIYWAMVKNKPEQNQAKLVHYLKRNPKQNKSYAYPKEIPDSKQAVLKYKVLKSLDHYHLIEIELETGRHHQIRSQLSYINCPIKGDLKYGAKRSNAGGGIHLHAKKLCLIHPTKKERLCFEASLPSEKLWQSCF
ncbi:RluA family pseudouridine synthase [Flavobacteriaceae bacterium 14752]|uniref:RluA family pseudouridine synthase n=1 Tax=Mesohalobacter salilacus TaxID=2491711 RepID=UPI000F63A3BE|nr:RluA family pseudouridine synthase [Flavobacteriaceae bacterium 14752]